MNTTSVQSQEQWAPATTRHLDSTQGTRVTEQQHNGAPGHSAAEHCALTAEMESLSCARLRLCKGQPLQLRDLPSGEPHLYQPHCSYERSQVLLRCLADPPPTSVQNYPGMSCDDVTATYFMKEEWLLELNPGLDCDTMKVRSFLKCGENPKAARSQRMD